MDGRVRGAIGAERGIIKERTDTSSALLLQRQLASLEALVVVGLEFLPPWLQILDRIDGSPSDRPGPQGLPGGTAVVQQCVVEIKDDRIAVEPHLGLRHPDLPSVHEALPSTDAPNVRRNCP